MKRTNNSAGPAIALAGWLPRLAIMKIVPSPVPQNNEAQLTFVEVAQPAAEAPPKREILFQPELPAPATRPGETKDVLRHSNGKQTEVVKTENVPRSALDKFSRQPPAPAQQPFRESPRSSWAIWTPGKPENSQQQDETDAPAHRQTGPSRSCRTQLPGQQMKQAGGMRRHSLEISSLDAQATTYGAYDAALIDAVLGKP